MNGFKKIYLALIVLGAVLCAGCSFPGFGYASKEENIRQYVQATLDNCFKNENTLYEAVGIGTLEEAEKVYEDGIDLEIESLIYVLDDEGNAVKVSDEDVEEWREVMKEILKNVDYTVEKAEENKDGSYSVTVKYRQLKIFYLTLEKYHKLLEEQTDALNDKYTDAYSYNCAVMQIYRECFKDALKALEYGEEQSMVLTVTQDSEGYWGLQEDAVSVAENNLLDVDYAQNFMPSAASSGVKLGPYMGIEVERPTVTVTEKDVENAILLGFSELANEVERTTVELHDLADISVASIKIKETGDVILENRDINILVGDGSLFEGFDEQLIGKTVGEALEFELVYPEDYINPDLCGKTAVFNLTVTGIKEIPELTDAFIAENSEFKTYKELYEYVVTLLNEEATNEAENLFRQAVLKKVIEGCTFSPSISAQISTYEREIRAQYEAEAEANNMSFEDYLAYVFGMTKAEFDLQLPQEAAFEVKVDLALYAIGMAEGFTATEEEISGYVEEAMIYYGMESYEETLEGLGLENIKSAIIKDKALTKVLGTAIIK